MLKFKVGDRVYHRSINANGIISDIDPTKKRDVYKVEFFWAKYCDVLHGDFKGFKWPNRKWQWCEEDKLILCYSDSPYIAISGSVEEPNKVSMIGGRSLDRLVREVCEIPRRRPRDGSKFVINYGKPNHRVPKRLCLNSDLVCNKYEQCKIMGEDLTPESCLTRSGVPNSEDWIIKPIYSIGGKGITLANRELRMWEYFQRKFNKVREFRVHCFMWLQNNPVPLIQEKLIDDKSQLCWNKKQGGRFRTVYQNKIPSEFEDTLLEIDKQTMIDMSVKALSRLGYDFGGIDFGMDAHGNFKIFEVNSRMGLRERSLFTYKRSFQALKFIR